jgi:hypothetical protein
VVTITLLLLLLSKKLREVSLTPASPTLYTRTRTHILNFSPDGQAPKRRGPKPDSKPALTRRQELNRQAQRYTLSPRPQTQHLV